MIYFNSKYLSEQLGINTAKWKRWVREFLSPDPLGGLRSGYARHFNLKDAFRVHLGGLLVSALRFSIPETRQMLTDLDPLLDERGFYNLYPKQGSTQTDPQWLCIFSMPQGGFEYAIQGASTVPAPASRFGRMLNLSDIYMEFLDRIEGSRA
jgi:hypothetical protein